MEFNNRSWILLDFTDGDVVGTKVFISAIHANLGLNSLFLSVQMLGGLISYAIFVGCDPLLDGRITAYDQIFPHLVMHLFQNIPVLRGVFLSTIFAAALSTLSSGINGIACVLVEDVFLDAYLRFNSGKKIKQKKFTLFARLLAVLLGLIIVGLAFLLKVVPAGVLNMAFSIFGAVGGPILTVFTLGILFPFVNKWGALFGFLASLATGIGMALGSIFAYTYKEYVAVPLTNASCPLGSPQLPLNTTAPPPEIYEWSFFNLASLYYTLLCLIVGILISFPISFCTGLSTKRPVSHSLMAWQAVKLYSYLPSCVPPQSTNVPVTSSHARKLCAIVDEGPTDLDSEASDEKEKGKGDDDSDDGNTLSIL